MTRSVFLVLCLLIFNGFDVCSSQSTVTVHFSTSMLTVDENSSTDIELVAQGTFDQNFTVNLTFSDGTARYLMDYFYDPLITPSVTFTPGSISSSVFRVIAVPNNIWEGAKSFEVGFVLPSDPPNLESGRPDTLRVNIADDDSVRISFQKSIQTVMEDSNSVPIRLQSHGQYGRRFSVSFRCIHVFPVEAKDGEDFTGGDYTVEFQTLRVSSSVSSTAEIPKINDSIPEFTKSFICVILRPRGEDGIVVEDPTTITVVIEDDDLLASPSPTVIAPVPPKKCTSGSGSSVTVHFNTSVLTVAEGSFIDIQLITHRKFCKNVKVNLTFTDGTARSPMDYFYDPLITPSVTFTPGSISSSVFRVTTIPNNIWEGAKSFEVGFDLPAGKNLKSGRPDTFRVNIADDDPVHISFERSTQTVREDSGSVLLHLQSCGLYGANFSVSFHCFEIFPVEAKDGEDFTGGVYTVEFQTFFDNSTVSSTAEILIVNDWISEPTESFICVILRPRGEDGIVVEDPNTITFVIEDDDCLKVSFEKAVYSGEEGSIPLDIRLKATSFGRPFSVQIFATTLDVSRPEKENEATSGVDYTDPRFLPGGGVVRFNPILGLHSTCVTIPILSDNIAEGTEYFALSFVAISDGDDLCVTPVEPTMAIVAINDPNALNFTLTLNAEKRKEGRKIIARVNPAVVIKVAVDIKLNITDGTAERQTADISGDYKYKDSDLTGTIDPTDPRYAMTIMLLEDDLLEGPETFTITLESATLRGLSNPVILPLPVTVTILDEDNLCVTFGSTTYSVNEGGTSEIVLLLDKKIARPVNVFIEFEDNSATSPDDYDSRRKRVRLPTGATMGKFTVGSLEDNLIEDVESFIAFYQGVSIGAKGCDSQTTVKIVDGTLADVDFNPVDYTVMEGGNVALSVELSAVVAPGVRRQVDIRTENGTAHSPGDFNGGTFTVEFFGSNQTSLAITTTDDNTVEGTETFTAILENPSSPLILLGDDDTSTISITETESITVYFSQMTYFVNETSNTVVITAEVSGSYDVDFNVTVSVLPGTAQFALDYNSVSVDLTFQNGIMSSSFEIEIIDDDILERDEDIRLRLFVPKSTLQGANVLPGVPNVSRVVIIDNEAGPWPTITFEKSNMIGSEGDIISFHLIAMGMFIDDFSVEVIVEALTATPISDYALLANPLGNTTLAHFTVGHTNSSMVMIFLSDNNAWESRECFTIRIVIPPGVEAMLGNSSSMTVCINDDDEVEIHFTEDTVMVDEGAGEISLRLQAEGIHSIAFSVSVICLDIFPVEAKVSGRRTNETDAYPNSHSVQFSDLASLDSVSTEMKINITDDLLSEPTECFICLILRPFATRGINVKDPDTLTICIKDNDVLGVCFATNEYNGIEGNSVSVRLKTTGEFVQPFKARIFSSSLPPEHPFKSCEADEGEDYTSPRDAGLNSGIVNFGPGLGSGSTELILMLFEDDIVEKTEYFRLHFAFEEDPNNPSPIPLSKCSPSEVLVAIQDNNEFVNPSPTVIPPHPPEECTSGSVSAAGSSVTVYFNTSTLTVDEGSNIDIQLVARGNFSKNVIVNLTFTDGTAKYLIDYIYLPLITPSVTFTPGSISSSVFRVIAVPNNKWEGTKSFEVGFVLPSDPPNLESGRPDTLRVNIADDNSVRISFQKSIQTVMEDSNSVPIRLQSHGQYGRRFSVSFACIEVRPVEAKDGEDFTGGVYTVEFQALGARSSVSSTAEIPILDNSLLEHTESFICVILRLRGEDGIVEEDPNTINIIIEDDDSFQVSFEKAMYSAEEGKVISDIRLKATEFERPFSVQIFATTLDASRPEKEYEATSGADYTDPRTLGGGVAQFNRVNTGLLSTSLTIPIQSDNIAEGTEYFGLSFVAITNGDDLGIMAVEPTMAIVAINDTNEIFVRFKSSNFEIDEDASSLDVYFEVVRKVSPGVYLPAEYTFDFQLQVTTITVVGSATENIDFEETVGSVTFSAGEQYSTPFSVNITDDTLCEGPEQFTVSYSINSSSVRSGANVRQLDTTATVVINDDDAPYVRFVDTSVAEREGKVVSLRVNRSRTITRKLKCTVRTESTTAIAGVDYRLFTNSIEFQHQNAASEVKTIYLQLLEDNLSEGKECFHVVLDCRPEALTGCYPPTATVCIQGN